MRVRVVRIGRMRMGMAPRRMGVPVAVRADGHRVVRVVVVAVVVAVGMFVLQRLVRMLVRVRLGQVQQHARQHRP
ncbi:MAG: hypothetical protein RLZZ584_4589, partial [Pseudomonadota bacterium]